MTPTNDVEYSEGVHFCGVYRHSGDTNVPSEAVKITSQLRNVTNQLLLWHQCCEVQQIIHCAKDRRFYIWQ